MDDVRWMQSALALARRALGTTWPNPAVACLIVRDGRLIGRAITAKGGRPHAETQALEHAVRTVADGAQGATAYVTLEPCAHHGRTPPCADALIGAGIKRVVCALADPDPRVNGQGIAALEAAGVEVHVGTCAAQARALNAGFLSRIERGRPHVLLKLATTLDGRIATRTGESRWITGSAARRRVHAIRARSDAVLIGSGTAKADDPMLNVRGFGPQAAQPVRVVADSALSLPLTGRLAATAGEHPLWILHRAGVAPDRAAAFREIGANLIEVDHTEAGLSIDHALTSLAQHGLTRVMCEGGGQIAASLLRAGVVDEIAAFCAGKAIGGDGIPAVRAFGLAQLEQVPAFGLTSVERLGNDTLSWWSRMPLA